MLSMPGCKPMSSSINQHCHQPTTWGVGSTCFPCLAASICLLQLINTVINQPFGDGLYMLSMPGCKPMSSSINQHSHQPTTWGVGSTCFPCLAASLCLLQLINTVINHHLGGGLYMLSMPGCKPMSSSINQHCHQPTTWGVGSTSFPCLAASLCLLQLINTVINQPLGGWALHAFHAWLQAYVFFN